jgi:hypothetical protein
VPAGGTALPPRRSRWRKAARRREITAQGPGRKARRGPGTTAGDDRPVTVSADEVAERPRPSSASTGDRCPRPPAEQPTQRICENADATEDGGTASSTATTPGRCWLPGRTRRARRGPGPELVGRGRRAKRRRSAVAAGPPRRSGNQRADRPVRSGQPTGAAGRRVLVMRCAGFPGCLLLSGRVSAPAAGPARLPAWLDPMPAASPGRSGWCVRSCQYHDAARRAPQVLPGPAWSARRDRGDPGRGLI